jgi:GAF domain-containing protein
MMTRIDDDATLLAARRCGVDLGSGERLGVPLATPTVVCLSKRVPHDVVQRPEHELERLRAVYDAQVLDTPPEELFDDLTHQAAAAFDAPISLVSIVDADRQWFKSRHGLDVSETPREVAFCAHAICEPDVLIVPDAAVDHRFARNPLVTGEYGFRFYAGAQIRTSDGLALGTLCVIDRVPRQPTQEQILVLERLAHVASIAIELRGHIRRRALADRATIDT